MHFDPTQTIWLILGLPLLGVLVNGLIGHRLPRGAVAWIGCLVVVLPFVIALVEMWPEVQHAAGQEGFRDLTLYQWITQNPQLIASGPVLSVPFAVRLDALSLTMVLVVTGVGSLIHIYSTGYMA